MKETERVQRRADLALNAMEKEWRLRVSTYLLLSKFD